ncbi:hypothetical protein [Tabrizicola sp. M-4]|uniref:hypothetical protein n=1 Tax=Tabrizicola sp. M-4 TaxID=3055847 RepID=UPI003DA87852
MAKGAVKVEYVFDLHGIREILATGSNFALSSFSDGLADGSIKILSSVSRELKDVDEALYKKLQHIKSGRVYIETRAAHYAVQQALMEKHGSSWYGGIPPSEHFEVVAIAQSEGAAVVTGKKQIADYKSILKKCAVSGVEIYAASEFYLI